MTALHFTVDCVPEPWRRGNPRMINGYLRVLKPAKSRIYAEFIAGQARRAMRGLPPMKSPCEVTIRFGFEHAHSTWRKREPLPAAPHIGKNGYDVDNLAKAVLDAMNDVVYEDDSQVQSLTVSKRIVPQGQRPFIEVAVIECGEFASDRVESVLRAAVGAGPELPFQ